MSHSQVISSTDDEADRANNSDSGGGCSSDKETFKNEDRATLKNGRIKGTLQRGQSQDLIVTKSSGLLAQEYVRNQDHKN